MAFAAFLLFAVIPGHTLSIHSDTFSSFVDFYNNVCPPCHNDSEPSDLENRCCSFCDCDLEYCKEYGTCCLGVYNSFEEANESVSKTV